MILLLVLASVIFLVYGGSANVDTALKTEDGSIEGLQDVAMHMDPETYMKSNKLKRLQEAPSSIGKVLFPASVGAYRREKARIYTTIRLCWTGELPGMSCSHV